jgi:predicted Zn-dependent protease with MMP-like domain
MHDRLLCARFRSSAGWRSPEVRRIGAPAGATLRPTDADGQAEIRASAVGTLPAVHVSRRRFEQLVAEALDDLPEDLLEHSDNIVVLVEDAPPAEPGADSLFGVYEGVARTDRGGDAPLLPDRITLFRRALTDACDDEDELYEQIRITLVHEFAHHFGIDDDRLEELGWA